MDFIDAHWAKLFAVLVLVFLWRILTRLDGLLWAAEAPRRKHIAESSTRSTAEFGALSDAVEKRGN